MAGIGIVVTTDKSKIKYEPITGGVKDFEDTLRKGEVTHDRISISIVKSAMLNIRVYFALT